MENTSLFELTQADFTDKFLKSMEREFVFADLSVKLPEKPS